MEYNPILKIYDKLPRNLLLHKRAKKNKEEKLERKVV